MTTAGVQRRELKVKKLGLVDYQATWEAMKRFTRDRDGSALDELWLLEHHPVFSQGQAGKAEHIIGETDIPIIQSDRGGQVTYHGPGQLIAYVMLDIRRLAIGVRDLVTHLENAIVRCLSDYGINSQPRADAPGVYVGERKIASLGLRVRNGCSFHGLALNVSTDLAPFALINPCGYAGMEMVNLRSLLPAKSDVTLSEAADSLSRYLALELGMRLYWA